jgi:hypothetical protein
VQFWRIAEVYTFIAVDDGKFTALKTDNGFATPKWTMVLQPPVGERLVQRELRTVIDFTNAW